MLTRSRPSIDDEGYAPAENRQAHADKHAGVDGARKRIESLVYRPSPISADFAARMR